MEKYYDNTYYFYAESIDDFLVRIAIQSIRKYLDTKLNNPISLQNMLQKFNAENADQVARAILSLNEIDPTYEKNSDIMGKYFPFILKIFNNKELQLLDENFLPSQESKKLTTALSDFNFLVENHLLPKSERGLSQFHGYNDLIKFLETVEQKRKSLPYLKNLDERKLSHIKVEEDYVVLYNGEYYEAIQLESYDASVIIGRSTSWCTAANTENGQKMFEHYAEDGYLCVVLPKIGKRKYQIYIHKHNNRTIQELKDENDNDASIRDIYERTVVDNMEVLLVDSPQMLQKLTENAIAYLQQVSPETDKETSDILYETWFNILNVPEMMNEIAQQDSNFKIIEDFNSMLTALANVYGTAQLREETIKIHDKKDIATIISPQSLIKYIIPFTLQVKQGYVDATFHANNFVHVNSDNLHAILTSIEDFQKEIIKFEKQRENYLSAGTPKINGLDTDTLDISTIFATRSVIISNSSIRNLVGSSIQRRDLSTIDISNSDVKNVSLKDTIFTGNIVFSSTKLGNMVCEGVYTSIILEGVMLSGNMQIKDCGTFKISGLTSSDLKSATFHNVDELIIDEADISNVDSITIENISSGVKLSSVKFSNVNLYISSTENIDFIDTTIDKSMVHISGDSPFSILQRGNVVLTDSEMYINGNANIDVSRIYSKLRNSRIHIPQLDTLKIRIDSDSVKNSFSFLRGMSIRGDVGTLHIECLTELTGESLDALLPVEDATNIIIQFSKIEGNINIPPLSAANVHLIWITDQNLSSFATTKHYTNALKNFLRSKTDITNSILRLLSVASNSATLEIYSETAPIATLSADEIYRLLDEPAVQPADSYEYTTSDQLSEYNLSDEDMLSEYIDTQDETDNKSPA